MDELYNQNYYTNYDPKPYDDRVFWMNLFGSIADRIVANLNPSTVLDAGCAMGHLVAALRDRGVAAYGIDVSEYAISQVREDIRPYCVIGSLTEPLPPSLPTRFDLIVTIEVMEHLTAPDGNKAIKNLCNYSDEIIFVSTPDDYEDETHFNVQKSDYWVKLFAENGLYNYVDYVPDYIAPYALFFRRYNDIPELVASYERLMQAYKNKYEDYFQNNYGKIECVGKIYLDTGNGFNENEIIALNGVLGPLFSYEAAIPEKVCHIRFDPIDGTACIIKNFTVTSQDEQIDFHCNGTFGDDGNIIFSTQDPWFDMVWEQSVREIKIEGKIIYLPVTAAQFIEKACLDSKQLIETSEKLAKAVTHLKKSDEELVLFKNKNVEYSLEIVKLQEANILLNHIVKDLNDQANNFRNMYHEVVHSTSWKLTKPVRFISRYLRKIAGRLRQSLHHSLNYFIDCCEYSSNILAIKGWMFLANDEEIGQLQAVITSGGKEHMLEITDRIRRPDVYAHFQTENTMNSGFKIFVRIEDCPAFTVRVNYKSKSKTGYIKLGSFQSEDSKSAHEEARITVINSDSPTVELEAWTRKNTLEQAEYPAELYDQSIDVVVPVYNGYEYLKPLFDSIAFTKMRHRLIIVDDHSPDKRVWAYIQERFQSDPEAVLVSNEENLGFVKSVNRALTISKDHVAIVNTDTEMPPMWLERLMGPIIMNKNVASSTPFTNAGTICSFPQIGMNNPLFEGLDLNAIDAEFQKLRPTYCPLPTGVGFCMGMSRDALKSVGLLDADTFSKGYGEENDWCQRAIRQGYKNVAVENLFVYHKHGGSFSNEEKRKLLEANQKLLVEKHPDYLKEVARFFEADFLKPMRHYVTMRLSFGLDKKAILVFDHNLGGGATSYIDKRVAQWLSEGYPVVTIRFNPESQNFFLLYKFRKHELSYTILELDYLRKVFEGSGVDTIYINELVSYAEPYKVLDQIIALKTVVQARLVYLFHDYYALCPSCNLLNDKRLYCGFINSDACEGCIKANEAINRDEVISRKKWTEHWSRFLHACDDIIVFSQSSAELVSKVYGNTLRITVKPHQVDNLLAIDRRYKITTTLNIGLLGVLTYHKGAKIIRRMLDIIARDHINAKIVLIGSVDGDKIDDPNFIETGRYSIEMLPRLVYEHDIDLFFISSIWPETFSYTTEEIIQSNLPVVAFDLGAPAERIRSYNKGRLVSKIDADMALEVIQAYGKEVSTPVSPYVDNRILFVTEYITFSSRYRVEHLREQLVMKGVASDFTAVKDIGEYSILDYDTLYIYRCTYSEELESIIEAAQENRVRVLYDIDDYIFDYEQIKGLDFLKKDEYKDFEQYAEQLKRCMALCDGFVTSTDNLKERIMNVFPDKSAFVNRNVASMEMVTLSQKAVTLIKRDNDRVVLGYFSGSKTHDKDFLLIKNVLLELMARYSHLYLMLGGVVETIPEFDRFEGRVITHGFMSWQRLPELIASADINLMPLEDTVFHACKSENKWTEAALVKVPTVASYNSELTGAIDDGVTGYLCRTAEEWRSVLEDLIVNKSHREQIGTAAYEKVMQKHTTASIVPELVEYIINRIHLSLEDAKNGRAGVVGSRKAHK